MPANLDVLALAGLRRSRAMRVSMLLLMAATNAFATGGNAATAANLIGDARCDSDAQCRTVAVGAQRCGGPTGYLAWSTQRTSEAALAHAIDNAATALPNDDARHSTCGVVRDPGASCVVPATAASAPGAGRCQLRAAGRGQAALPDR